MAVNGSRIKYIDLFRGVGIICMIMDHVGFGGDFYKAVHVFHMPMFFFLSGFCYKKSTLSFVDFMKKKSKGLLLPYFVFGLSQYIVWLIFKGTGTEPLKHLIWINTEGLVICGAIWFLSALFIADIVYYLLDKYVSGIMLHWVIFVLALFGCIFPYITGVRFPWAADSALVGVGFVHLGRLLRKYSETKFVKSIMQANWWQSIVMVLLLIVSVVVNTSVNMRTATYGIIPLFWLNALLSIVLGMRICNLICIYNDNLILKFIQKMGEDGIIYVCLNQFVIALFVELEEKMRINHSAILETLLVILVLFSISRLILLTKLRALCGK